MNTVRRRGIFLCLLWGNQIKSILLMLLRRCCFRSERFWPCHRKNQMILYDYKGSRELFFRLWAGIVFLMLQNIIYIELLMVFLAMLEPAVQIVLKITILNLIWLLVRLYIQILLKMKTHLVFVIFNKEKYLPLRWIFLKPFGQHKVQQIKILIFQDH